MYKLAILILIIIYCTYHTLSGDRGLITVLSINDTIFEKQLQLNSLEDERKLLERKINSLKHENVDLEYLEELARSKLGIASPQEVVLVAGDLR